MTIFTEKRLKHNREDITVVFMTPTKGHLSTWFCQRTKILCSEEEKVERYQDLALEVKRIHRTTKKTVIAIVIDALGTISKNARPGMGG